MREAWLLALGMAVLCVGLLCCLLEAVIREVWLLAITVLVLCIGLLLLHCFVEEHF